jgi:hypothetical protein
MTRADHPRPAAPQDRLRRLLESCDLYTAGADADLVDAARRYTLLAGRPHAALSAAVYARWAAHELYGAADQRVYTATTTLAALIERHGRPGPELVLPVLTGSGPDKLLETRLAGVRALHQHGLCEPAAREEHAALTQWLASLAAPAPEAGIYLLAALQRLDLCGRVDQARGLLEACRRWLPTADPPWAQLCTDLGTAALGNLAAILAHRTICTGHPADAVFRLSSYRAVHDAFLDTITASASVIAWPGNTDVSRLLRPGPRTPHVVPRPRRRGPPGPAPRRITEQRRP